MKEYLKQHFVPQFYLKCFGEHLYCYDKLNGNRFRTTPKNIGHKRLFYDTKTSDGKIENFLKDLDDRFARAYSYVLEKRSIENLPDDIKSNFFLFLSCQMNRTNILRNEIKYIFEKASQKLEIPKKLLSLTEDELKADHASIMFEVLVPFAEILFNKTWIIMENKTTKPLWTSDNPFILTNQMDLGLYGNLGLFSKGLEIHFPLNNTLKLFSFDPTTHKLRNKDNFLTYENVKCSNTLQTQSSSRFIYSKDDDFKLAKRLLKEYPQFKNPAPKVHVY